MVSAFTNLFSKKKPRINPKHLDATGSHYVPSINYADEPIQNSVWRSDFTKPITDFWGNHARIPDSQVLTTNGALLFPLKAVTTQGYGGTSIPYGQYVAQNNAGLGGQQPQLNSQTFALEWNDIYS